ncbi:MAG: protoporphyrinogen oxidase [Myxococcota bacterium]
MTRADCIVIGGGIAGLACASELAHRGWDVRLLEAADRVGGPVETRRVGDLLWERAALSVRSTPALEALAERVGCTLVPGHRGPAWVLCGDRLVQASPVAMLSGALVPGPALLRALGEPFRRTPPGPLSVRELVEARLGSEIAERLADLATLGIHGAASDHIGFEAAFPGLARALGRHGSLTRAALAALPWPPGRRRAPRAAMVSTREGLGPLVERLGDSLGPKLSTACRARAVRGKRGELQVTTGSGAQWRAREVVLAVEPAAAATLVEDEESRGLLRAFSRTPQTLAIFALRDADARARWRGIGFLAPTRERAPLLGCLFSSFFFDGRAPADVLLLSVFVAPRLRGATDSELAQSLAPRLERWLEASRPPELIDVARHSEGIPLYDPGHPERVAAVRTRLGSLGGPRLAGWGYDGVAFGAAAASGVAAARAILADA